MRLISLRKSDKSEAGFAGLGLAGVMLGFGFVYFIGYFILNWIYETKEERRNYMKQGPEIFRPITKEEVMKRGVGKHVFVCSGLFSKTCRAKLLFEDTVDF
jgi:hypothetical protein